ncbi:MAG: DUF6266 family protein [Pedobacter sp.]|nr:DUF6266 family protein [Pedobacter sp.]MDQ8052975.1 DUF6266 family protein [Pedobacter sp.]
MAVFKNGLFNGLSGKVGNAIVYPLYGQNVMRSRPGKRTKKAGPNEQATRDKFALMQHWLQPLLHFLRIGFKNYAQTFQGFVAAKSYNSRYAFKQHEDGSWYIDPACILVSHGALPLPHTMGMEVAEQNLTISWSVDPHDHDRALDGAMIVMYMPDTNWVDGDFAASRRHTGQAVFPLPLNPENKEIHVYLAFVAYDHSAQSKSHYLGTIELPEK